MKRLLLICCVLFVWLSVKGQSGVSEAAFQKFKSGDFEAAYPLYQKLLQQFPKDIKYNYYLGACMVETNRDISQASKYLRFSSLKGAPKEVMFYLARANQLNYEFEEALLNYTKYLKAAGLTATLKDRCTTYMEECKTGTTMTGKIFDLTILKSDTTATSNLLSHYKPSAEMGTVMKNGDFFESGINPEGIMFLTERGDLAMYSSNAPDGKQYNLFKMEKLIDGWGEPVLLGDAVNSKYDERYPFLLTDGVTLYFSSNRPGGLGGFDIYKATYNSENKAFNDVVNLGIPYNSPADDYFFVCDEFKNIAWFSSNRAATGDRVVVYCMKWDNSIVKNNVSDINQVKQAAMLIPSGLSGNGVDGEVADNLNENSSNDNAQFHFPVTDTLEYTRFEHFRSAEARTFFEKGFALTSQKDSLSKKMKEKRRIYATTSSDVERNKVVNEILILEKKTYGLDDAISKDYYEAQRLEQAKIKELVRTGQYQSFDGTQKAVAKESVIDLSNIPQDLPLFSNDEFGQQLAELQKMYPRLFAEDQVEQLRHSDSLYVWGNILNLESSRLLEKASKMTTTPENNPVRPFGKKTVEGPTGEELARQSQELKLKALELYHKALDEKNVIYNSKYRAFKTDLTPSEMKNSLLSIANESNAYYKNATELTNGEAGILSPEKIEKSGTLKRKAVEGQERGLLDYLTWLDSHAATEKTTTPNSFVAPSYSEIQKSEANKPVIVPVEEEVTVDEPENTKAAINAQEAPVYKIQIGVYRNQPDVTTLGQLKDVTSVQLDNGLTKYFCGKFSTYEAANAELQRVRQGAFPAAFIVSFVNEKQIPVTQARELEGKH
jgi:tetratricopeptide (TPR) repeat protein